MAQQITCPSCSKTLNLPDTLIGKEVRCPNCQTTFTAEATTPPQPAPSSSGGGFHEESAPDEAPPRRRRDEEYEEEAPRRRDYGDRDGGSRPHRGVLVLLLGIFSTVAGALGLLFTGGSWLIICCMPVSIVLALLAIGLGLPALILGQRDLAAIRSGEMDRAGEGQTKAGWICGIIGVVLGVLCFACGCLSFILVIAFSASQQH
jgi:hypothetical protein